MGVSNNFTCAIQCLWGSVVGLLCVGEGTCLETGDLDGELEGRVGGDLLARFGRNEDCADHVVVGGNLTHDCL